MTTMGKVRRSLFLTVLALGTILALCDRPALADALDDITKAGVIRVGVFPDFPPFTTVGPDMQLRGYDADMAEIIAKELKVKPQLVHITGQNRIPMLQEKRVDILLSVGFSDERAKVVDYTAAYAPYYVACFGLLEIKVKSIADMGGTVVGVNRGTLEDTKLTADAPPGTDIRRFDNYNSVMQAFLAGQVQLIVVGNDVGSKVLERQSTRKAEQKFLMRNSPDYIALNKNEPRLKEELNKIVAKTLADGTLNNLSVKWLNKPLDPATLQR